VPRPSALEHTGQAIVGDAVKRVSYGNTFAEICALDRASVVALS
jgi:hypothetical protein